MYWCRWLLLSAGMLAYAQDPSEWNLHFVNFRSQTSLGIWPLPMIDLCQMRASK
jgi:hypothetical protein